MLQLRDPNVEADQFWDTFVNGTNELIDAEESEGRKLLMQTWINDQRKSE